MTRYVGEPSQERKAVQGRWGVEDLRKRPAPPEVVAAAGTDNYAILAIPPGTQSIATNSLTVVTGFTRSYVKGTALSVNASTGLITINAKGLYDIHSWAEMDFQGAWDLVEGPVFQAGQDYQDVGNGLHTHRQNTNYVLVQHKTTLFVANLPQSLNLQVLHLRGSADTLVNGGLTVVKLASYP